MTKEQNGISNVKIKIIRFLVGILLLEAIVWAIMIMVDSSSSSSSLTGLPLASRFQLMFWVFAGVLIGAVLGFRCLEKGEKISRIAAWTGMIAGLVAALIQLALIWGLFSIIEVTGLYSAGLSVIGKIMLAATIIALSGIGVGLVSIIEDNGSSIGALKFTAMICGACFCLITVILIFVSLSDVSEAFGKALPISGVAASCFVISSFVALLLSWFNRKDAINKMLAGETTNNTQSVDFDANNKPRPANDSSNYSGVSDDIIEREVQERMAAEKEKAKQAAMPPLQDENLVPTVSRDNEVKIEKPVDFSGEEFQNKNDEQNSQQ